MFPRHASLCAYRSLLCVGILALAAPASAQDEPAEPTEETAETDPEKAEEEQAATEDEKKAPDQKAEEPDDETQFGHAGQPGLRLGLTGGYRMIFRYDESPLCAPFDGLKELKKQQKFCGHVAPFALDLALSYAPFDSVEPFLWARFGFTGEDETITDPVLIFGAGVRLYTMSESAFKIFIEPAFGVELEDEDADGDDTHGLEYKTDMLFHVAAGPQVDVSENFGLYLDAGITTGVLRAIHSMLEVTLGVQGRL